MSLAEEIRIALNKHSAESYSDTPDYVLAEVMIQAMVAFNTATIMRDKYYRRDQEEEEAPPKVAKSAYVSLAVDASQGAYEFFKNTTYPHVTLGWYDLSTSTIEEVRAFVGAAHTALKIISRELADFFSAKVQGHGILGDENTTVLLVEAQEIERAKQLIDRVLPDAKTFPHFIPHVSFKGGNLDERPDKVFFEKIIASIGFEDGTFTDFAVYDLNGEPGNFNE